MNDAHIEKLVSRVRQKIETDPAHPRYWMSVRGCKYKLVRWSDYLTMRLIGLKLSA